MGVDNAIEAYHIDTRYVPPCGQFYSSYTWLISHLSKSFRIGIHQLTWTPKKFEWLYHECISSFTIKSGLCILSTLYPWLVSFYPVYLNESSVEIFIIPFQPWNFQCHFQWLHILLLKITCLYNVCCKSCMKCVVNICIVFF